MILPNRFVLLYISEARYSRLDNVLRVEIAYDQAGHGK